MFTALCLSIITANAQSVANYAFTATSGTFTPLSGATSATLTGNRDEGYQNNITLPFDFWYEGTRMTKIAISTNGWACLGSNITNATATNNLASGGKRPVLAPLWDDLNATGATMSYVSQGAAPNRVFTCEWNNMKWNRAAATGGISFQIKLYERTGKIDFVYSPEAGSLNLPSASIGISGTATGSGNFLSVDSFIASPNVSSTSETKTLNVKPTAGQTYTFTPAVPIGPSNTTITSISQTAMAFQWDDNAINEIGYVIYRSIDSGATFSYFTQLAANTTSYNATSLVAGSEYYWMVYAVSEGGLSDSEIVNDYTLNPGSKVSNAGSWDWSNASAWTPSGVPAATDSVTVPVGSTVSMTTNITCFAINVLGTLNYTGANSNRTVTVLTNVFVQTGGVFQAATANGTKALRIGGANATTYGPGNLYVDGTFDMDLGSKKQITVSFFGNNNSAISGTASATCDFYAMVVNKGTRSYRTLDIQKDITITSPSSNGQRLTVTAGNLKLSYAVNLTPYYGNATMCNTNATITLNNPSAVLSVLNPGTAGTAGTATIKGILSIDSGSFSYGDGSNRIDVQGSFKMKSGTANIYGQLHFNTSSNFTMSGGTINIDPQVANDLGNNKDVFYLPATASASVTGGKIIIVDPNNNNSTRGEFIVVTGSGSKNLSGLTLYLGDGVSTSTGGSTGGFLISMPSTVYIDSLVIDNPTGSNRSVNVSALGSTTFTANHVKHIKGTLNLNGNILIASNTFSNGDVVDATTTNSHLQIAGTVSQTLGGTFISSTIDRLTIANTGGVTLSANYTIKNTLVLTSGVVTAASGITLGGGAATGFNYTRTNGSISGTITRSYGTGVLNFTYNGYSAQTTGSELPASASATSTLTIDNSYGVILNQAYSTGLVVLTQGALSTTSTNLLTASSTSQTAVTTTTGYVSGPLKRAIPSGASNQTFSFPVGKSALKSIDLYRITTGGSGTGYFTMEAFDTATGGSAGTNLSNISTNRYWRGQAALGTVTLTQTQVSITESGISNAKAIGFSSTLTGAYNSIGGGFNNPTLTSNAVTNANGYFVIGDKAALAGGTYTIGSTGTYTNLTAVSNELNMKAITGNVIFELLSTYSSAGETFPINFFEISSSGGSYSATIRVKAGAGSITTSGNPGSTGSLVILNGANNLILDGRQGGTGSTRSWTLQNTRTTNTMGPVFTFMNDANGDTLKYLNIEARNPQAASGVIVFSTTTETNGNDNNSIENCKIDGYSSSYPVNNIYNAGTVGADNTSNNISNCELANATTTAILLGATGLGDSWTITGNSIYNTQTCTLNQTPISILGGYGHTIANNYIGGKSANCGGSAWANSKSSLTFTGIAITTGSYPAANIYGNYISNFSCTGGGTTNFTGIANTYGLAYIGTSGANVIGDASNANSISISATGGQFIGISVLNSNANTTIENNIIANITNDAAGGSYDLRGIYSTGAHLYKNRMFSIGNSVAGVSPSIYGIYNNNVNGVAYQISNNRISLNGGSSSNPLVYGMYDNSTASSQTYFYHNTVYIYGGTTTTNKTYCFYIQQANPYLLRNNILYNNRDTNTVFHYAIANGNASPSTGWTSTASNYNLIYSKRTACLGLWGSTNCNLTTFRSNSSGDANSYQAQPIFTSITDLHIDSNYGCLVNARGTAVAAVTTDIDGNTRHASTPDAGADELSVPNGQWYGWTNNSWSGNTNWCGLTVPDSTTDIEIDAAAPTQPRVTSGTVSCRNLQINAFASVALNGGNLNLYGNLVQNGNLYDTAGYLVCRGVSNHTLDNLHSRFVEMNTTGTTTLLSNATISDTLKLTAGKLTLGNYNLTISNGGAFAGGGSSSYIATKNDATTGGYLIMAIDNASTAVVFPVGTTTYTPARLVNSGTSNGNFRVRVFNGVLANGTSGGNINNLNHCVNRTWLVENVAAGTYNVAVRLYWNGADENANFSRGYCGIGHYTSGAWERQILPDAAIASGSLWFIQRNGFTAFSPFGVGDSLTPLPVKMLYFNAKIAGKNEVKLDWATVTEVNNDRFEIQRSTDGKNWMRVGDVNGNGNTNYKIDYTFNDNDVELNNSVYYRLEQFDFNGRSEYSKVQVVNMHNQTEKGKVVANVNTMFNNQIRINMSQLAQMHISLIDMSGKEVMTPQNVSVQEGQSLTIDNLGHLPTGMYMLQLNVDGITTTYKLMKNSL